MLHWQSAGFHTPACTRGFWLLQTFLAETKCLFVLREAQVKPCELEGGQHKALGVSAGFPGVQHACHSPVPVPVPVTSFTGSVMARAPLCWVFHSSRALLLVSSCS